MLHFETLHMEMPVQGCLQGGLGDQMRSTFLHTEIMRNDGLLHIALARERPEDIEPRTLQSEEIRLLHIIDSSALPTVRIWPKFM